MNPRTRLQAIRSILRECHDLQSAAALLAWDQETGMPPKAIGGRAEVLSTLAGMVHERFTAPAMAAHLAQIDAAGGDLTDEEQALVREVRRDHARATRIPAGLVRELAEAASRGQQAWQEARAESRFAAFLPHLETLVGLKKQVAETVGYARVPLDALLDEHETGMTVAALDRLFKDLKDALVPLVAAVAAAPVRVDVGPLRRTSGLDAQRAFAQEVAQAMGFDFAAGRLDRSTHPFCTTIHHGDVRLTWRGAEDDLRPALFGILHEAGHGLYEQGLPEEWARTPLAEAASLGVHESQSRLWENMVARSRAFWTCFLPRLKARCPGLVDDVGVDAMYRAVNEVQPSLIRVEADELTYNLHIVLRFELERDLFAGALDVRDLPEAFAAGMERLLGVRPGSDAEGVLQDIHWSMGAFGYFPTYTLGNLYAAQLFAAADRDLGGLDGRIAAGELAGLREWLRDRVHRHGRRHPPRDLIRLATGAEPGQEAFVAYVRRKFGEVYGLPEA